jgi:hypothetical protein
MGPNSPDVLVARLGRIFVRNAETRKVVLPPLDAPTAAGSSLIDESSRQEESTRVNSAQTTAENEANTVHVARYEILIQDMNVHNMNLEEKMRFLAQSFNESNAGAAASDNPHFHDYRRLA